MRALKADAARPLHRSIPHREDHGVALTERHHLRPRLHPGPLLGQHELAAVELLLRL
jgi:hypothetical protein